MNSYGSLAGYYDALTTDVPYSKWADYLEKLFARNGTVVTSIVDLGCGTGSLTVELASRGYHVTGVDLSSDMLAVAADKCAELEKMPLLLCQDMSRLTLLEQVDAVVCCLDSLNYVTKPTAVKRTFQRVWDHLCPGGGFFFDIRTPSFLRAMDTQLLMDETEDVYCVWRGEFSERRNILKYYMDLFFRDHGDIWMRDNEIHEEYAYEPEDLVCWLQETGFQNIKQYGNLKMRAPSTGEERIFFAAQKGKEL